jgi:hypothetical protein
LQDLSAIAAYRYVDERSESVLSETIKTRFTMNNRYLMEALERRIMLSVDALVLNGSPYSSLGGESAVLNGNVGSGALDFVAHGSAAFGVAPVAGEAVFVAAGQQPGAFTGLTITGTFETFEANPDAGTTYTFSGAGFDQGVVSTLTGSVQTPGFIAEAMVQGTLQVSTGATTQTLAIFGPRVPGFSPLPTTLNYTVVGVLGTVGHPTVGGTIAVTLTGQQFTFAFKPS